MLSLAKRIYLVSALSPSPSTEMNAVLDINRDMDELPSIIDDLEDDLVAIQRNLWAYYQNTLDSYLYIPSDGLTAAKSESKERLTSLRVTLGKLDELSDIMLDMLDQQQGVDVCCKAEGLEAQDLQDF